MLQHLCKLAPHSPKELSCLWEDDGVYPRKEGNGIFMICFSGWEHGIPHLNCLCEGLERFMRDSGLKSEDALSDMNGTLWQWLLILALQQAKHVGLRQDWILLVAQAEHTAYQAIEMEVSVSAIRLH